MMQIPLLRLQQPQGRYDASDTGAMCSGSELSFVQGDEERIMIRLFQYDEPNIGVVDMIRPPIKNENPQRSSYRHPTHQRNDDSCNASCTTFLGDDPLIAGGSSSILDTIGPPINHEYPQLRPYSSSTTLQSNGGLCNASFMTTPSYISSIVVQNYVAEVCLPGYYRSL